MADDDLKLAKEQFEESCGGSSLNRQNAESDIRFARLAEQWDESVKKTRMAEGRPCLTINRLPGFIRQVVNDARQAKPGIRVSPVDSGADRDTAQVIQGLIRHIERRSVAETAYDTAIDHAVTSGFGFFRLAIDYTHSMTFDMEARIERIANPMNVYWDISSMSYTAADWRYAFVGEFVEEEDFKKRYPDATLSSFEGDSATARMASSMKDHVHTVEWWNKEMQEFDLVQLLGPDGQMRVIEEDELPRLAKAILEAGGMDPEAGSDDEAVRAMMALGFQEQRRRKSEKPIVKRAILSGTEVLEENEWPGRTIPICPVWGDEVVVDGERHFRSMIRDAKDPQRMMNFWRSATTELVALAPKSPWLIEENALPSDEAELEKWETANSRSHAYLSWDGQQGSPQPQRTNFASVPTGALQEAQLAQDDIKAIIGIYDSSLGARSNETSGRAIMARQREADVSNFHFVDNLNKAIQYCGECLVDIIPAVYSGRQMIRILGDDGKDRMVALASNQDDLDPGVLEETGEQRVYNLNTGTYDVSVDAGPSYATQREEAREVLLELMRTIPGAGMFMADILARNLDFQGAEELEERAKLIMNQQMPGLSGGPNGQVQEQQPGMQPQGGMPGQPIPGQQPG